MDEAPRSVLGRALCILAAFTDAPTPGSELRLREVVAATGLPPATVHRVVAELVAWGALDRSGPGRYRVGIRLWRLGAQAPAARDLRDAALPPLQDLATFTGGVVHLVVLAERQALFLERLEGQNAGGVRSQVGRRMPVHGSGPGKTVLAHAGPAVIEEVLAAGLPRVASGTITDPQVLRHELGEIRTHGYCLSRDEMTDGASSVAAPIHAADGTVVAALSVVVPSTTPNLHALVPPVRLAAASTSRRLHPEFSAG